MLQSYTTDINWNDGNGDSDAHIMYVSTLEHHLSDYVHLRVIFYPVLESRFVEIAADHIILRIDQPLLSKIGK